MDAALYRLVQESVTNAGRHAVGASRVDVQVAGEPDAVRVTVCDDGSAGNPAGGPGYGLVGLPSGSRCSAAAWPRDRAPAAAGPCPP